MDTQKQEVILKIENLTKSFGKTDVLEGISMEVHKNEIISVLGPSGCGKSTLLNIIAGMLAPDSGRVIMNGQVISESGKVLPPEKRHMNMVFQDFALWPHMTACENISYGLKICKTGKEEIDERVHELLKLLHLEGLEKRYPAELSGGQQQRVAIARALITKPDILLMDEPLCNLDVQLRVEMRTEMAFLFRKLGTTVFHVTHDPSEAFAMADRIVILNRGNIDQIDSPQNCYRNPGTESVAALLGAGNKAHGYAREDGAVRIDLGGSVCETLGRSGIHRDARVTVRFRAENAVWIGNAQKENSFPVAVGYSSFEGDYYRVMAKMSTGEPLCFLSRSYLEKGTEGFVHVEKDHLYVYGSETAA